VYEQIAANKRKTVLLIFGAIVLLGAVGYVLGLWYGNGIYGLVGAVALAVVLSLGSFFGGDRLVLASTRAREVSPHDQPRLHNIVEGLSIAAGIPKPKVYLIPEQAPNAFATGRNPEHAAVAATTGIMQVLTASELRAVMAHELTHVLHRDILISTISATMAGAISMLANFAVFFGGRDSEGRPANPIAGIAVALLAPLAASLIQMAISRAREFEADRGGAEISGDPRSLASALEKIHAYSRGTPLIAAERNPATAQMMIINPLHAGGLTSLFSTHPATEERVARLLAMAGAMQR